VKDPKTFIEQYADIARRVVADSGAVAFVAANEIEKGTYGADDWTKSATQLSNIAYGGSLRIAQLVGTCGTTQTAPDTITRTVRLAVPNSRFEGKVEIKESFTRIGKRDRIPDEWVTFDPPVLKRFDSTFKVVVRREGLRRAHYRGTLLVPAGPTDPTDPTDYAPAGLLEVVTISL
jgi:hypothetical protein